MWLFDHYDAKRKATGTIGRAWTTHGPVRPFFLLFFPLISLSTPRHIHFLRNKGHYHGGTETCTSTGGFLSFAFAIANAAFRVGGCLNVLKPRRFERERDTHGGIMGPDTTYFFFRRPDQPPGMPSAGACGRRGSDGRRVDGWEEGSTGLVFTLPPRRAKWAWLDDFCGGGRARTRSMPAKVNPVWVFPFTRRVFGSCC